MPFKSAVCSISSTISIAFVCSTNVFVELDKDVLKKSFTPPNVWYKLTRMLEILLILVTICSCSSVVKSGWFSKLLNNSCSNVCNDYISFNGATGSSFSTSDGFTFSTSISLSTYGTLSSANLSNLLISNVNDNRDGLITLTQSNIIISGTSGIVSNITMTGTYSMTFNLSDLALNNLIGVNMTLSII